MNIGELIHGFGIAGADGAARAIRVCDVTEDSRTAQPGSLFIARRGEKSDGRAFVADAVAAGAVAILTDDPSLVAPAGHAPVAVLRAADLALATAQIGERFYGEPSSKLTVLGITGTNGKTTTTFLIHQILNALGIRCGLMGTVVIDDGTEVAPASLTTPPALEISRTLARMHEAGCTAAVLEVSSHALHQRRVGATRFAGAAFTNLSGDHLDYHRTMDDYAAAKAMLFAALPADGVAVVNAADPAHERMLRDCCARVVRCLETIRAERADAPENGCRAAIRAMSRSGMELNLAGPWGHVNLRVPLVGAFNATNALQAAALVHAVFGGTGEDDVSFTTIAQALARCRPPPGRLEPVTAPGAEITVLVDYAHTDDALRTVLSTAREALGDAGAELWCVFGCGGDRDATKRPRMGAAAATLADRVVVTSDNPRTENPRAIIGQIIDGIPAEAQPRVQIEPDRAAAINLAVRSAPPGSIILIAGKGHEDYQILPNPDRPGQTVTRHFDDREVAREALSKRGVKLRRTAALQGSGFGGTALQSGA
ncbi:MAG: UDP-N-acetylmuramoyl-L-alanyl-D-glutamate--2,6-diaminopimelate ligase [Phycisphaeraceae bacterium]|nr:UDP-N-acetylmuramoyl-L-alanyl-D-glutamate--2,6-diaminopimelate ligase [Phycisphaeraceae bacterium]MBX3405452.1 UDP-N-acetylmuramoyl-L-alanyl-D-glutamate--2,6-diaminopimelate ligase [Phycisphaeraceae bacterium]